MICPKCGTNVPDENRYCTNCWCDLTNPRMSYSKKENIAGLDNNVSGTMQQPLQNNGMMQQPLQNNGMMQQPIQNNGVMQQPIQNNGVMQQPFQNNGMMQQPFQNNGMMQQPIQNNGVMQQPLQNNGMMQQTTPPIEPTQQYTYSQTTIGDVLKYAFTGFFSQTAMADNVLKSFTAISDKVIILVSSLVGIIVLLYSGLAILAVSLYTSMAKMFGTSVTFKQFIKTAFSKDVLVDLLKESLPLCLVVIVSLSLAFWGLSKLSKKEIDPLRIAIISTHSILAFTLWHTIAIILSLVIKNSGLSVISILELAGFLYAFLYFTAATNKELEEDFKPHFIQQFLSIMVALLIIVLFLKFIIKKDLLSLIFLIR